MGLLQDFLGKSQRQDIANSASAADAMYSYGLSRFKDTTNEYLDRALSEFGGFAPSIESGRSAIRLLSDALGANGPEAQAAFFKGFQTDPGYQAGLDAGIEAVDRGAAARGLVRSGGQSKDLFSFGQRFLSDAFNKRLEQLAGLGQTGENLGLGVAGAKSGLLSDAGSNLANAEFATGQLRAGNQINLGNATAQSRSTGINNLLGLGNLLVNAFKPAGPTFKLG